MEPKVKISVEILSFGIINLRLSGSEGQLKQEPPVELRYVEPATTDIEGMEIHYLDGETYMVPVTTASL